MGSASSSILAELPVPLCGNTQKMHLLQTLQDAAGPLAWRDAIRGM
ncbi:hypothetical protein PSE_2411 [Pseudovibrio sp. FO-BEG1]|nr:hypothetical protein PSE_2411 [Pseudovibrio sp. FO-BEG1]